MQTSLVRRQRHRRLGGPAPRRRGNGVIAIIAIALPLLMFVALLVLGAGGALASVAGYTYLAKDLEDPKEALDKLDFTSQSVVFDRSQQGPAREARRRPPDGGHVRPDPARPRRRDDVRRGQDVLGELRLRPRRLRLRRHRHRQRQRPRRLDDHPAARARAPPAHQRLRRLGLRAQGEGDHPVDPPDRGVSGDRGQAADHREVPQPELLREPQTTASRPRPRATGGRTSRT